MSEQQEEPRAAREGLKFLVLVIVLLGAVAIVALTRPLIFGKIVPAVMGDDIALPTPEPAEVTGEDAMDAEGYPGAEENEGETAVDTEPAPTTGDEAETDEAETPGEEPATDEGETPAEEATTDETEAPATDSTNEADSSTDETEPPASEEDSTIITHTVKQGETLQTIAAQYGITLQQLIAANALPNPDYIRVGDKLIIPQSGE